MDARSSSALAATEEAANDQIRRALAAADPNVLRLALYHVTRDRRLAAMRTEKQLIWAGALFTYALAPEHHEGVRQLAYEFLIGPRANEAPAARSRDEVRQTMELFGHGPLTDEEFAFAYEEASFDEFPRGVTWRRPPAKETLQQRHVLIIGAGISGIAAAVELGRLGIPYTVIERLDDIGGTWHLNRYPECRVDSTSMIYQYKFEKKYPWSEFFASGGETKKYLRHVALKYGVLPNVRFRSEVRRAVWDETAARWDAVIRDESGREQRLAADFIISATGLFNTPKLPDVPGIATFKGRILQSAAWDPNFDLAGKRVIHIGTGATGVQLAPHVARTAQTLTVFQRTPNWVLPMEGYKASVPEEMNWLFQHVPYYWNLFCYAMYYLNAQLEGLQVIDRDWQGSGGEINQRNDELGRAAKTYIREKFATKPELIEKLIPKYPPMARRPTVDNNWYDTLLRDNVSLVTCGIREVKPDGVVDGEGKFHPCDVIVSAAGFTTTNYFLPLQFIGRGGMTPERLWEKDGPRAYLGLMMPDFPNLFTPFGPNAQGRSGSFYSVAEMWARYALKTIVHVIENGQRAVECRREAFDTYNARLDAEAKKLLWESYGQGFYYVSKSGRSVVNSPWNSPRYHALLLEPKWEDLDVY